MEPTLFHAGIRYVKDIYDVHDKRFYDLREIGNMYNFQGDYILYYKLVRQIPVNWKEILCTRGTIALTGLARIRDVMNVSRFIYIHKFNREDKY